MSVLDEIRRIAQPIVESKNAFIVDVDLRGESNSKVIELYIDNDSGMTTALCAEISRAISPALETGSFLRGSYHFVVSSPGLERSLRYSRQYPKNVGRTIVLKCRNHNQTEKLEGELIEATTETVSIRLGDQTVRSLPYTDIVEAQVVASF
jgi:ribosome maturation factor RimP